MSTDKHILDRSKDLKCICNIYPDLIEKLFNSIDSRVFNWGAVHNSQTMSSMEKCLYLISNIKNTPLPSSNFLGKFEVDDTLSINLANEMLGDEFTIYGKFTVPRNGNGCLDWHTKGSNNDYNWGLLFNRHIYLIHLINAYKLTDEPKYIFKLDTILRDWIISNPWVPRRSYEDLEWNERPWRSLEVALRGKVWAQLFYLLQDNPHFSDSCRILMLSSLVDHTEHLLHYSAWPDHSYPNIYLTELVGLARIGQVFHFFRDAHSWIKYAVEHTEKDLLTTQTYPDGVQKELATHYHKVALLDYEEIIQIGESINKKCEKESYDIIENMTNYLVKSIKPNGDTLLNGDSVVQSFQDMLLQRATKYKKLDWQYIITRGTLGTPPDEHCSHVFPWAGQAILRNTFEAQGNWLYFDGGPYSVTAHGHRDKLHISLFSNGREILVDSGRTPYIQDCWLLDYFRESSAGHNVILINGHSQCKGELEAKKPIEHYYLSKDLDFITSAHDAGYYHKEIDYETAIDHQLHRRSVFHVPNRYWLVIDTVETDTPCDIQPLWHFHPHCTVAQEGDIVRTTDDSVGNLLIIPLTMKDMRCDLVKGQLEPSIQGWYNHSNDNRVPTTCATYNMSIQKNTTIGWLMIPYIDEVPELSYKFNVDQASNIFTFSISMGRNVDEMVIPIDQPYRAKIHLNHNQINIGG